MAFAAREMRSHDAKMPVAGVLSSGIGLWKTLAATGHEALAQRACASALAVLGTGLVFSVLDISIDAVAPDVTSSVGIDIITLTPPTTRAPRDVPQMASADRQRAETGPSGTAGSPVDVSTSTALSNPEWSVSRIRIATPQSNRPVRSATGTGSGNGSGPGSASVYDPYAGATPMRAPERAPIGLATDRHAMAVLTQGARTRGLLQGLAQCDLLVALSGTILEAHCQGGNADTAAALSDFVVGQRPFLPTPVIRRVTIELGP